MFFLDPSSLISATTSASSFIGAHPELIQELAQHVLTHSLYSHIRSRRGPTISRSARRRVANRRRRWFVDNIIMHHKRLHDQNREIAISNVRKRLLEKKEALKKQSLSLAVQKSQPSRTPPQGESTKWRERFDGKDRGLSVRGRIDTRRIRARSRWLSVSEDLAEATG